MKTVNVWPACNPTRQAELERAQREAKAEGVQIVVMTPPGFMASLGKHRAAARDQGRRV